MDPLDPVVSRPDPVSNNATPASRPSALRQRRRRSWQLLAGMDAAGQAQVRERSARALPGD